MTKKRVVKFSEMRTATAALAFARKDPEFREIWEKTAIARAVSLRLVTYRADHELSQTQLAAKLGMKQPAIARLEAGEKNPTWETLTRLSEMLGIEFVVGITPTRRRSMIGTQIEKARVVERVSSARSRMVVAAS